MPLTHRRNGTASTYLKKQDELRDFALEGARVQLSRILRLFPELRAEALDAAPDDTAAPADAPLTKAQQQLKQHTLKHWDHTNGNGHGPLRGIGLRAALLTVLDDTPRVNTDLRDRLQAQGFQHHGRSSLGSRVSQEMFELVTLGKAQQHKAKGKGKSKHAWTVGKGA